MLDDIYLKINSCSFDTLLNQTAIQTAEDADKYAEQGYDMILTLPEYEALGLSIPADRVWYTPSLSNPNIYYNPETLAACNLNLFLLKMRQSQEDYDPSSLTRYIEKVEAEVAQGNYSTPIVYLSGPMRMEYFGLLLKADKKIPDLYRQFIECYGDVDYGFSSLSRAELDKLFSMKTAEDKEKTTTALDEYMEDCPDVLTVYRGENSKSTPFTESFSWSLDVNTAVFFASRRGNGPARIIKGEVSKENIIEFIEDRGESEIVVPPECVKNISVVDFVSYDEFMGILPTLAPMFQKYSVALEKLEFVQDSDYHNANHELRVLLLTQFIAEQMRLPASDRKILATAAIYHDLRRESDGVEPCHGKKSKDFYHSTVRKPDPLVEFLCEYHCLPDEVAYEEIKNNRVLSKNRSHSKLLYDIFCDADNLDRVRLPDNLKELDYNQLRTDTALTLPLIARILYSSKIK